VRWIESRSLINYEGDGPRLVGANIEVTDRKQAERALDERNMQLSLAGKAARVGSYAYDIDNEIMQISEGYAAIHGLPEGTVELARSDCLANVHPDDIGQVRQLRSEACDARRSEYSVEYRIFAVSGEVRWVESRCFIAYDGQGRPLRVVGVSIDITQRKRVEEQQRKLIAELDHRVKNVLATVAAVAANARETSSSMQHFVAAVDARIRALAFTHELLSSRRWQGLPLAALLRCQLAPYAGPNNTHLDGPDVLLTPEAGQALGMVLHELTTNAAKYGALSVHTGRVSVQWSWSQNPGAHDGLVIKWQEAGGPAVKAPGKFGYGTSVINHLIPYELGGKTDCEFLGTGVCCRLEIPATWAIRAAQPNPNLNGASSLPSRGHEASLIGVAHG
jgi:PAS domain S-box-containing protein